MVRPFRQTREKAPKRTSELVVENRDGAQRLHKLLASAGLGSRRDMEALIANGRVSVNGVVATVGAAVLPSDIVRVDGRPLRLDFEPEWPQVLLYHKPEGEIVSQDDPEKRATVFDKLPRIKKGKWIAIGRLDMNTSGLLIFTTSGELANRFMHPRYEVEREYAVRIFGELSEEQLSQLTQGVELEDGPASFDSIYAQGGEGANHWYQVVLREGRNREVRRLFEAMQLQVSRLMRVRFGPINLPPRVKRGQMLKLSQKEVAQLLEWAELPVPRTPFKQLTQREKDKQSTVFMPKVRKQRVSVLDREPRTQGQDSITRGQRSEAKPTERVYESKRRSDVAEKSIARKQANADSDSKSLNKGKEVRKPSTDARKPRSGQTGREEKPTQRTERSPRRRRS